MPDLNTTLAVLKGQQESLKQAKAILDQGGASMATLQASVAQQIQDTVTALNGLDTVGFYSSVDQLLRTERFAGKSASVDYIKANPTCAEADAIAAWASAGIAATGQPALIVPAENYAVIYRANLLSMGLVPDTTWESQRAWIVATDKAVIMGA